jgi:hypothetical protein
MDVYICSGTSRPKRVSLKFGNEAVFVLNRAVARALAWRGCAG